MAVFTLISRDPGFETLWDLLWSLSLAGSSAIGSKWRETVWRITQKNCMNPAWEGGTSIGQKVAPACESGRAEGVVLFSGGECVVEVWFVIPIPFQGWSAYFFSCLEYW